jgi:hypothetical protein
MHCMTDTKCHVTYKHLCPRIVQLMLKDPMCDKTRALVWIRKNQLDVTFLYSFISLLIVSQHVSGNHVPIIRSWWLCDVIASCWYVPWLQGGCQDQLAGSASMDGFVAQLALLARGWGYEPIHGCTTCQPVLTTFAQPRHIPTRGYNITQSSAPDDGHMVARNMLSNY